MAVCTAVCPLSLYCPRDTVCCEGPPDPLLHLDAEIPDLSIPATEGSTDFPAKRKSIPITNRTSLSTTDVWETALVSCDTPTPSPCSQGMAILQDFPYEPFAEALG